MNRKASVLVFSLLALSLGCTQFQKRPDFEALGETEKRKQQIEMQIAQDELDQMHYQNALQLFQKFKLSHGSSPYFQKAQMGEAKAFSGIGKWSEAAAIYREVVDTTRKYQPELAAESLYELSFCYESLGDEAKTTASLLDAERMKDYLSPEVAQAELPARLAGNYFRLGQKKQSSLKLAEAEAGLQEIRARKGDQVDKNWLAKIYFMMGYVSTNQLSEENFKLTLESLQVVQKFSLLSMEQRSENWSALAAEGLHQSYKDLVQLTETIPLNKSLDHGAALRQQSDQRSLLSGMILENIQKLKLLRNPEKTEGPFAKGFFVKLGILAARLNQLLLDSPAMNTLTLESLELQSLKKDYKIKVDPERDQLLPAEMGQGK